MFPVLIDLGRHDLPFFGETHLFLPTYGAMFATGAVVAWVWFLRRARGLGVPDDKLFNLSFYSVLAGILGAKLLLVALEWRTYVERPAELVGTLRSAGVLAGGVIAGAIVFAVYARRHGLPALRLGDAGAAPVAAAQGIGRIGCFLAGCCWGVPVHADHPLACTFTDPRARAQTGVPLDTPLVAVQLVQAAHDLLLAAVLTWLWRKRVGPPGFVVWVYVIVYGIGRSVIELWRGDAQRGVYFDGRLSTSQILALAAVAFATFMLARSLVRRRQLDGART
jgi:phosphatidylglycerol:prolipoprotein diacylglycerol transferase